MRGVILVLAGLLICMQSSGQHGRKVSREDYIQTYADLAMREMLRTGIPASITLAQGCLESDNGNSRLAVRANNHFGIKCHEWNGRKIYHDDDARKECFRSYASPYESYRDHSAFLTTKPRYASLFELRPDDYKGWARGLKRAGYATARDYAHLLIRIIEENELHRYDLLVLEGEFERDTANRDYLAGHEYTTAREIMVNNRIEYIIAEPGDTPESLRKELELFPREILRYNNLDKGARLEPGQVVYLQPKRRRAARGNEIHVVEEGQSMYDISQIYGVKLKHLYKKNRMSTGEEPVPGQEIFLRRKRREPLLKLETGKDSATSGSEAEELKFRFDY